MEAEIEVGTTDELFDDSDVDPNYEISTESSENENVSMLGYKGYSK